MFSCYFIINNLYNSLKENFAKNCSIFKDFKTKNINSLRKYLEKINFMNLFI
jgi:hypothetical protein